MMMNKYMHKETWFALLATLLMVLPLRADIIPDSLQFTEVDGGYAVGRAEGTTLKGALVIPATHEGKPVVEIREKAFHNCHGLTSATLPAGIRKIGSLAFWGCDSLKEVTLPKGLTSIGMAAFAGCINLKAISLPAGVTSVQGTVFDYCTHLASIDVVPNNASYCSVQGILYDKAMQTLVRCPGAYRGAVAVPEGVTTILGGAFIGCPNLTAVTVPVSVETIGRLAFFALHNLKSIHVQPGNTSYRSIRGVLYDRSVQTLIRCPGGYRGTVDIPAGVTNLDRAFMGCSRLKAIRVASGNTSYRSVKGMLYDRSMRTLVCCPGGYRGTAVVPEGVTTIGNGGFFDCFRGLKQVDLPASLESIGERAFWHCKALTRLTCRAAIPPKTKRSTFETIFEKDAHFRELPLYVPAASIEAYRRDEAWGQFQNILPISGGFEHLFQALETE